jgi:hypothetical protein
MDATLILPSRGRFADAASVTFSAKALIKSIHSEFAYQPQQVRVFADERIG